jgi:hypothetical protein
MMKTAAAVALALAAIGAAGQDQVYTISVTVSGMN